MAEPDNTSPPNDPRRPRGADATFEDEIERLLEQAETLATEIATSTGVEPAAPAEDVATDAGVPDGSAPDPVAATQAVEEQLAELDELVAAEQQTQDAADVAASESPKLADADQMGGEDQVSATAACGAAVSAVETQAGRLCYSVERESDGSVPEAAARGRGPLQDAGPATGSEIRNPKEASEPVRKRRSLKELLIGVRESAPRVAKAAALVLPHVFLGVLEAIDRPFTGLSPKTKRAIGYVALITVVMGIASLVLPLLLNDNPYANMPP